MLILKYFLFVGTALTVGLFALSAQMETDKASASRRVHSSNSIAIAPPPPKPVAQAIQIDEPIAAAPESKTKRSSSSSTPRQSGSTHRAERAYHQQQAQRSTGFFRW